MLSSIAINYVFSVLGRKQQQSRVPSLEPVQEQTSGRHSGRSRPDPHAPWQQSAVLGGRLRDDSLARFRRRRPRRTRLRRGILAQIRARPHKRREEAHQYHPDHRGRPTSPQVQDARGHGGHGLRRRRPARPGPNRGPQLAILPQKRRPFRHLHQGLVYRLYGATRGRFRGGSQEASSR